MVVFLQKKWAEFRTLVFCYQNCSDLLWEKIVLVIEKIFEVRGWSPGIHPHQNQGLKAKRVLQVAWNRIWDGHIKYVQLFSCTEKVSRKIRLSWNKAAWLKGTNEKEYLFSRFRNMQEKLEKLIVRHNIEYFGQKTDEFRIFWIFLGYQTYFWN